MKSNLYRFVFFIFSFLLTGTWQLSVAQQEYIPHYTAKDGLPGNNCYFILQDKQGFIWIATDAGVSRYDGKTFTNYSVDDGLPDNQILQLKEDKKGRIWFLALNGQMSYFYNGRIYNPTNDKSLKPLNFNAAVVSLFEDSKGRFWFGTNKNMLAMWNGKVLKKFISTNNNTQFINSFVYEDASGIIRAYSTQAVHKFNETTFILEDRDDLPLSYKTILSSNNHHLLFLKKDGLYQKEADTITRIKTIDPNILNADPGYFYSDSKALWISTSQGVFAIRAGQKTQQYLPETAVNQVLKDRDGNYWFTTSNGVYMLPYKQERLYIVNKETGLSSNQVKSITKDAENRFWLGLDNATIDVLDASVTKIKSVVLPDKIKYNKIKQLQISPDGKDLYFASEHGLGVLKDITTKLPAIKYLREKNNSVFVIKDFSLNKTHTLALALSSGVVILPGAKDNLEFNSLDYKEHINFFKDRSYQVFYDKQQNLWFSNINGLSELAGNQHIKYYLDSKLLDKRINDICELENGVLAMATDGYGIILLKDGKIIKRITTQNGLSSNICYKLFYKNNFLWTITNMGTNKINLAGKILEIKTYDYASDLLANEVNDLYIDNKNVYFATNNGLIYFANDESAAEIPAPKVYITAIQIGNKPLDLGNTSILLNSNYKTITFNYTAVDFKNRTIVYRYRLKKSAEWTETSNTELGFSSLEPGNYTFEISARSIDGKWGAPTVISLELQKRYWQTTGFWIICSILAAFILYRIAVFTTKRQKNKEKHKLLLHNKILTLEQQALQALMNPHFIFNVMNSIQHFINTQDKLSANKVLTGFARLIRKNLDICTKSYISIEEEMEYLNLYLSLEKSRFGEKFNYHISVDPEIQAEEVTIPSMLLQPFVENAIWHGLIPKEEGGGLVDIALVKNGDLLEISIVDNGIGYENSLKNERKGHVSKGMSLTRDRIKLINQIEQNAIQLTVKQTGTFGTEVKITIPIHDQNR